MNRAEKASRLRALLARYRGGRFATSGSGGAGGMLFFIDDRGQDWYMGGFKPDDAHALAEALNLTMELLQESRDTESLRRQRDTKE